MALNIAEVEPGALRLREAPLLNTSDKSSWPVPVVVPAKVAKASTRFGTPDGSAMSIVFRCGTDGKGTENAVERSAERG